MTNERPKWPESLPPPIEMVKGPRRVHFTADDFREDAAIHELIHDLYWFQEDEYYLFFEYGEGIGNLLRRQLEAQGVAMKKTEMYFYRHPKTAYKNDFIRVMPNSDVAQWQQEAAEGKMYGRISLSLESARRKQIDFTETARVTTDTIADSEPVVDAKPNFFGIGLNLNSLWHRIKHWFSRKPT